jgi:nanoRNase/pAp phosphatase (c-di-AMP/oligoRNAs hydrolase)
MILSAMSEPNPETQRNLGRLEELLKNCRRLIVMTHDNPDPDAISSAVALAFLVKSKFKIPAVVRYGGIIGRAENLAMTRVLKLPVRLFSEKQTGPGVETAFVDAQPKTGNVSARLNKKPLIIIDHHTFRKTSKADLTDIRTDYGATATIMTEYLAQSGLEIPSQIATALSYGISSETQDLGREASEPDIAAYLSLFHKSNKRHLAQIVHPKLPRDYFITLSRALHHTRIYKNAIATCLGEVQNPDFVSFVADVMVRCERISWSICLGRYADRIIVSVRTTNVKGRAGSFLRRLIGKRGTAGGHGMMAGGQIQCPTMEHEKCTVFEEEIVKEYLAQLGHKEVIQMTPLLVPEPIHD